MRTASRGALISAILDFLAGQDLLRLQDIRHALEREVDEAGPDALVALRDRLASDHGWDYYPPDPLARRIHHLLAEKLLDTASDLSGAEHALAVAGHPVAIIGNHLSYADANVLEILLQRAGCASLANRLTAIAGPKVFTSRQRRFSSLCFGTVKVPQSAEVSSGEAVLNARDVARAARQSIEAARQRLRDNDALVIFPEGTRSRTGGMQQMLAAVARYLDVPGTWILPVGLTGTDTLYAIGDQTIRPARVRVCVGHPIEAAALWSAANGNRQGVMDAIGRAVAGLLPPEYRGYYGEPH